ncbi:hypothetical protein COLSTE_01982 [Collinsella stercoris DSM 13279]|uniref:Uncharacterized protein n=1 Tax=Collinsella stercoris DSM 13279 TaxID=445975 RepID=B6GD04_9ACTN|nr:hypothetical protein COLSTE_01982 [Collinsella stercoris DSM 13279]
MHGGAARPIGLGVGARAFSPKRPRLHAWRPCAGVFFSFLGRGRSIRVR